MRHTGVKNSLRWRSLATKRRAFHRAQIMGAARVEARAHVDARALELQRLLDSAAAAARRTHDEHAALVTRYSQPLPAAALPAAGPAHAHPAPEGGSVPGVGAAGTRPPRADGGNGNDDDYIAFANSIPASELVSGVRTFENLTMKVRRPYQECLQKCLHAINSHGSNAKEAGWIGLTMLAQWVMWQPREKCYRHARQQIRLIERRCIRFVKGDWRELHTELQNEVIAWREEGPGAPVSSVRALERLISRSRLFAQTGQWSKCLKLLESLGVAPADLKALDAFRSKFPQDHQPPDLTDAEVAEARDSGLLRGERVTLDREQFGDYLRRLPAHTAPDALGHRADYYRSYLFRSPKASGAGSTGIDILFQLCDNIAAGAPPEKVKAVLYLSTGSALLKPKTEDKPDGDVRPVCVTGILRKLASGTLLSQFKEGIVQRFEESHQYGASKDGNVKVFHAIKTLLEADPTLAAVSMDCRNAFNCVSRFAVLKGLRTICPQLIPFFCDIYARCNKVRFSRSDLEGIFHTDVSNKEGVQQGCTFGSILFCIATLETIERMRFEFCADGSARVFCICDDVYIVAKPLLAMKMAAWYEREIGLGDHTATSPGPALSINRSKSHVYSPMALPESPRGVTDVYADYVVHTPDEGIKVLGGYIGADAWVIKRLGAHTQELIGRFWRLELLSRADLFIVQQLVPMCYISRFSHLLRYHAPSLIVEAAREFDALTMALMEVFFKIEALTPEQCTRASLPRRLGGWALRSQARTRHAAFAAGFCTALTCKAMSDDVTLGPLIRHLGKSQSPLAHGPLYRPVAPIFEELSVSMRACADAMAPADAAGIFVGPTMFNHVVALGKKGAQSKLTRAVERLVADNLLGEANPTPDPRHAIERRARWNNITGTHASAGFKCIHAFIPGDKSNAAIQFALEQQLDMPFTLGRNVPLKSKPNKCPCCNLRYDARGRHLLMCKHAGLSERHEQHQKCLTAFSSVLSEVGLSPAIDAKGHAPIFIHPGVEENRKRPDLSIGGMCDDNGRTILVDVTVVGATPAGVGNLSQSTRAAANKHYVTEAAERLKIGKYEKEAADEGYGFVPFVLTHGGRMGKLAQGLLKRVYAAVRDCVDEWYYYGCLVPKIEAALMLGCYGRALGSKRDMMAQHMPNGGRDNGCTPPPPGPAHSRARWGWSEGATFDCDARWSAGAEGGACAFDEGRSSEYYAFLRRAHPQWFATSSA